MGDVPVPENAIHAGVNAADVPMYSDRELRAACAKAAAQAATAEREAIRQLLTPQLLEMLVAQHVVSPDWAASIADLLCGAEAAQEARSDPERPQTRPGHAQAVHGDSGDAQDDPGRVPPGV